MSSLEGVRCKNLLVQNRKATDRLLIVTPPDATVDLGALGRNLGVGRLSFCSPSEMPDLIGVAPGAMSPFALIADRGVPTVRLLVDAELRSASRFLVHPLVYTATLSMNSGDLSRFLSAIDHPPEFVAIPRRTAASSAAEARGTST